MRISLVVIPPRPEGTRAILTADNPDDPDFIFIDARGEIGAEFACGHCDRLLARLESPKQVQGVVFECPGCGRYNDSPL